MLPALLVSYLLVAAVVATQLLRQEQRGWAAHGDRLGLRAALPLAAVAFAIALLWPLAAIGFLRRAA